MPSNYDRPDDRYVIRVDYEFQGYTVSRRWRLAAYAKADSISLDDPSAVVTVLDRKTGKRLRRYVNSRTVRRGQ